MGAHKLEVAVAAATLILVVYTLALSILTQVMSSPLQENKGISNAGSLRSVGVGVYWDASLTDKVSWIDWGMLESGSNKTASVYIRNEGNLVVGLTLQTSNWNPSNTLDYMNLTWDYGGQTVSVGEVVQVTFMLSVSPSVKGIANFSFDILIVGIS